MKGGVEQENGEKHGGTLQAEGTNIPQKMVT